MKATLTTDKDYQAIEKVTWYHTLSWVHITWCVLAVFGVIVQIYQALAAVRVDSKTRNKSVKEKEEFSAKVKKYTDKLARREVFLR
jgi:hypothetical protein